MSGLELSKIKQSVVEVLKRNLKNNLFAIVSVGSIASKNYKESWSDMDILAVVEKLDLQTKQKMARLKKVLEKSFKRRFGINTITKQEFQNPILPAISLDGKTLQALLDLKSLPERLIFSKNKNIGRIYSPDKKNIKDYSISNLFMFLLRNRKTLTGQIPETSKEYKDIVEREMRAGFIMTKLAIQYFTMRNCGDNKEIIQTAEKLFTDFNFETLRTNLRLIDEWRWIKERRQLDKILESTDLFIEKFSHYILKTIKKSRILNRD